MARNKHTATLSKIINEIGEDAVTAALSAFSCPLAPDIEHFIRNDAISFNKQGLASTHIVATFESDRPSILGFFTLTYKFITIPDSLPISKTLRKSLKKYGTDEREYNRISIAAPLLAQFGRNFAPETSSLTTGDELMVQALETLKHLRTIVGGKFVYLECKEKPKLIEFYTKHGFAEFDRRGEYIRMLRYLKS